MEFDRGLEVLDVAEAAGGLLHPLDRGGEGFPPRIGDAMGRWRRMSFATAAIGAKRVWVARQTQRAKNVWAAPG